LKLHRVKTRLDTLKTIVLAEVGVATASWLTALGASARIAGMIAAPLFSIKQRQITLLEEEQKASEKSKHLLYGYIPPISTLAHSWYTNSK
jgi:hypothetical protein